MINIQLDPGEQDLLYEILEDAYYGDQWKEHMRPLIKQLMDKVDGGGIA